MVSILPCLTVFSFAIGGGLALNLLRSTNFKYSKKHQTKHESQPDAKPLLATASSTSLTIHQ